MRRPAPPRPVPPPLELECLKSLWRLGEASVRQVRDDLAPARPLAYTTVMTLLDRLVRKGGAVRRKRGRMFLYSPLLGQDTVRSLAVKDLVDTLFDGSPEKLLVFLQQEPETGAGTPAETPPNGLDTSLL
ncbi:MAG: BlaI/MecI/CopY family transcriptional regulator [Bryobacteraceae bacterium]|nr:BlaI/MecI/CopY family transcriptional regulator [Bryobacteraceae bacterium]